MKLFIRTDSTVIKDALTLTRPVFVEKYKDTASTEKVLQEVYHQLRMHHVSKHRSATSLTFLQDEEEENEVTVVEDNTPAPEDNTVTKVTIQRVQEITAPQIAKPKVVKVVTVEKTAQAAEKGKKEQILELLADGKKVGEVVKQLALNGLVVSYAYVNKLSKTL